ncbi:MAG: hypothetical protein AAFU69_05485, partial [Pseudomonadota bacterium]
KYEPTGLVFGSESNDPRHKTRVVLKEVVEMRLDLVKVEGFLLENYETLGAACKRTLLDANRFVIDKVLVIKEGEISFVDAVGLKVDLSADKYEFIRDAALKAGYSATRGGALEVQGKSVTFAVRQADFGSTLERIGIDRRGEIASLEQVLLRSNYAIPY